MRGSKARGLRRLACLMADQTMDHPGKVLRDKTMYQMLQGRRTGVHMTGTPFIMVVHKPGTPRHCYRRLKHDSLTA